MINQEFFNFVEILAEKIVATFGKLEHALIGCIAKILVIDKV